MKVETRPMTAGRPKSLSFTITFEDSDLHLQKTPFGVLVELAGCTRTGTPGGPALPVKVVQIALPPFTRPDAVTFKSVRSRRITRQRVPVAPQQPPPPPWPTPRPGGNGHGNTPPYRPPQPELYEAEIAAPRPLAQFVGARHFGFTPVVAVRLNPVRYRKDGALEFHSVIEVTILVENASDLAGVAGGPAGPRTVDPERFLAETLRTAGAVRSVAEHEHLISVVEHAVINPDDVAAFDYPQPAPGPEPEGTHLIITDDYTWDAANKTPDTKEPKSGYAPYGLVATFAALAAWRTQTGTRSRVVTITDIVNDVYGKFKEGAVDLQEVIRNFLKWARFGPWGVKWVLLGGDVGIVPVRLLADNYKDLLHKCWVSPCAHAEPHVSPEPGESFWTGAYLKMNVEIDALAKRPVDKWYGFNWGQPDPGGAQPYPDLLLQPDTGIIIPHRQGGAAAGTEPAFWYWTDATYVTPEPTDRRTGYVHVEGPEELVNRDMQWLYHDTLLPTDFYYASLGLPDGEQPREHDWDVTGNGQVWGVYGQRDAEGHDGIRYEADIHVGRAPVRTATEAFAFIDKAITYEKAEVFDPYWPTRSLYVSANWDPNVEGIADDSMMQIEWLRKQMHRDFPGIHPCARLYEDWADLPTEDQEDHEAGLGSVFGPEEHKLALMKAALRAKPHLVLISSHAWPGGIAWMDSAWIDPTPPYPPGPTLNSGMPGFIVYANGCASNEFDVDYHNLPDKIDPVGKTLLRKEGEGAVAYIGPIRMCFGYVGYLMALKIFNSLSLADEPLLGSAFDARCGVLFTPEDTVSPDPRVAGPAMAVRWMTLGLHLLGDPAMRVWTGKVGGGLVVDSDGSQVTADGGDQSSFDMHLTVCTDYDPSTEEYGAVIDGSLPPAPPRAARGGAGRNMPGRPDSQASISPRRRLTVTLPPNTAGDLKITVSAPGRAPLIVTRHLARPGWVSGRVTGVTHGGEQGREARVTLRLEKPRGRMASGAWLIRADEPDYDVLVNAALSAYATRNTIALYVEDVSAESPVHGFRLAETR